MKIASPSGHFGNSLTTGGYSIESAGTLFVNEFWDDQSYEIVPNNVDLVAVTTTQFGDETLYVTNANEAIFGRESCEVTDCTIMHFDRDAGVCTTNYTNDLYVSLINDPDTAANTDEYWFIKKKNPYDNMMYSSEEGLVEVNKYPPFEFRIWICMKCYNDF